MNLTPLIAREFTVIAAASEPSGFRIPGYLMAMFAISAVGLLYSLLRINSRSRVNPDDRSPKVFRFAPVIRIGLHVLAVSAVLGAFFLPSGAESESEERWLTAGMIMIGALLSGAAEFLTRQKVTVFADCIAYEAGSQSFRIPLAELDSVEIRGTGIFFRSRAGTVYSCSVGFSQTARMLALIEERKAWVRNDTKRPNKSPEPTPTAVTPRATELKSE